jgi:hypothetical protein
MIKFNIVRKIEACLFFMEFGHDPLRWSFTTRSVRGSLQFVLSSPERLLLFGCTIFKSIYPII